MEFVKVGKNYMIKGSNGRIITEEEKIKLENKELVLKDIEGCECQKETTKKISKNKKRLKELKTKPVQQKKETDYIEFPNIDNLYEIKETALKEKGDSADDIIEETA